MDLKKFKPKMKRSVSIQKILKRLLMVFAILKTSILKPIILAVATDYIMQKHPVVAL